MSQPVPEGNRNVSHTRSITFVLAGVILPVLGGCGAVPKRRSAKVTHEVAAFDCVAESVRGYINNLNTHAQYADIRRLRDAQ